MRRLPLPWTIRKVVSAESIPAERVFSRTQGLGLDLVPEDSFSRDRSVAKSEYGCQDPRKSVGGVRPMASTHSTKPHPKTIERTVSEQIHTVLNHGHEGTETLMGPLEISLGLTGTGWGYICMGFLGFAVGGKILTRNATGKHAREYQKGHRRYQFIQGLTKLASGICCLSGGVIIAIAAKFTPIGHLLAAGGLFAQAINSFHQSRQASNALKVVKSLKGLGEGDESVSPASLEALRLRASQLKRSVRNTRFLALGAALTGVGIASLCAVQMVMGPTAAILTVVSNLAHVGYGVTACSILSIWCNRGARKKERAVLSA